MDDLKSKIDALEKQVKEKNNGVLPPEPKSLVDQISDLLAKRQNDSLGNPSTNVS